MASDTLNVRDMLSDSLSQSELEQSDSLDPDQFTSLDHTMNRLLLFIQQCLREHASVRFAREEANRIAQASADSLEQLARKESDELRRISSSGPLPPASAVTENQAIGYYLFIAEIKDIEDNMDHWSNNLPTFWSWMSCESLETAFYAALIVGTLFAHLRVTNRYREVKKRAVLDVLPSHNLGIWRKHLQAHYRPPQARTAPSSSSSSSGIASNRYSMLDEDSFDTEVPSEPRLVLRDSFEELPHLAVFSWVCWEFLYYFDTAALPDSILSWLLSCLKLENLSTSTRIVQEQTTSTATILDVIGLSLRRDTSHSASKQIFAPCAQILHKAASSTIKPDILADHSSAILKACFDAITALVGAGVAVDKKEEEECRHDALVALRSFSPYLPTYKTSHDPTRRTSDDRAVGVCTSALKTLDAFLKGHASRTTHNTYRGTSRSKSSLKPPTKPILEPSELSQILDIIHRCLVPVSFRFLHRQLSHAALKLIGTLMHTTDHAQLARMLLDTGIVLALRLHLALFSVDPRWLCTESPSATLVPLISSVLHLTSPAEALLTYVPKTYDTSSSSSPFGLLEARIHARFYGEVQNALKLILPLHEDSELWSKCWDVILPPSTHGQWPHIDQDFRVLVMSAHTTELAARELNWTECFWLLRHFGVTPFAAIHTLRRLPLPVAFNELMAHTGAIVSSFKTETEWHRFFTPDRLHYLRRDMLTSQPNIAALRFQSQCFFALGMHREYLEASYKMCGIMDPSPILDALGSHLALWVDRLGPSEILEKLTGSLPELKLSPDAQLMVDRSWMDPMTALLRLVGSQCGDGSTPIKNLTPGDSYTLETPPSAFQPSQLQCYNTPKDWSGTSLDTFVQDKLGSHLASGGKELWYRGSNDQELAQWLQQGFIHLKHYPSGQDLGRRPALYLTSDLTTAAAWSRYNYKEIRVIFVFLLDSDLGSKGMNVVDLCGNTDKCDAIIQFSRSSQLQHTPGLWEEIARIDRSDFVIAPMTTYSAHGPDPFGTTMFEKLGVHPTQMAVKSLKATEYLEKNLVGIIVETEFPPEIHELYDKIGEAKECLKTERANRKQEKELEEMVDKIDDARVPRRWVDKVDDAPSEANEGWLDDYPPQCTM